MRLAARVMSERGRAGTTARRCRRRRRGTPRARPRPPAACPRRCRILPTCAHDGPEPSPAREGGWRDCTCATPARGLNSACVGTGPDRGARGRAGQFATGPAADARVPGEGDHDGRPHGAAGNGARRP
jgi:hypothetical protein